MYCNFNPGYRVAQQVRKRSPFRAPNINAEYRNMLPVLKTRRRRKPLTLPVTRTKVWQSFARMATISQISPVLVYFFPVRSSSSHFKNNNSGPRKRSVPKIYSITRRRRAHIAARSLRLLNVYFLSLCWCFRVKAGPR